MNVKELERRLDAYKKDPSDENTRAVIMALQLAEFICPYVVDTNKEPAQEELLNVEAPDGLRYLAIFTSVDEMKKMTGKHKPKIKVFNYAELERALVSPYNHALYGFIVNVNSHHVKVPVQFIKQLIKARAAYLKKEDPKK